MEFSHDFLEVSSCKWNVVQADLFDSGSNTKSVSSSHESCVVDSAYSHQPKRVLRIVLLFRLWEALLQCQHPTNSSRCLARLPKAVVYSFSGHGKSVTVTVTRSLVSKAATEPTASGFNEIVTYGG